MDLSSQIVINEFMAANSSAINDPDNDESSDWIELYNTSNNQVDLSGFYLTDNLSNAGKWLIPSGTIIQGNGFLVIWADGNDVGIHTSFKLSSDGEELGIFDSNLNLVDGFVYDVQETDISYGRQSDGSVIWAWFSESTPGASNSSSIAYSGITYYEPEFSIKGGFYINTQSLELTSLGGIIHYTLDGTAPTANDPVYINEIVFNESTFVRARVFQGGFIPGPIITHSYFVDEDFENRGLPVVSLVTNPDYFWDASIGLYVQSFKPDWEYPLNIEFFENDGNNRAVFNERAGVKVKGLNSWMLPQKMLGITFKNKYGKGKLEYPLFDDREIGKYDDIVLRASGSDWSHTLFRDALCQSLTQENGSIANQGFRQCVVFVNGEYMGIHNLRSNMDESFIQEEYGLEPGTFDVIENNGGVDEGTDDQFMVLDALLNSDLSIQSNFDQLESILDIENYTDYWISEIWCGNTSWGHNVKLWKPLSGGKWQFLFTDFDRGFTNSSFELSEFSVPKGGSSYDYGRQWMANMFENDGYASYFAQRFNDHIYTTYHPLRVNKVIDEFRNPLLPEIAYHVDRWSGTTSSYGNGIESVEFWNGEVLELRTYAEERHAFIMNELQTTFSLNSIVNLSAACVPDDAGRIRINEFLIPQFPWNGPYFEQMPLMFTAIPNPGYDFIGWSKINTEVLVSLEESWKFNDSGSNLGETWRELNFDDSSWSEGNAELGYGDNDETTVVSYGGNSSDKYITTYFRKQFLYSGVSEILNGIISLRRDDGAVIYLNGIEVARSNLPTGVIDFETHAVEAVAGDSEENLVDFLIELPMLSDTNVIAVEIHQYNGQSSDISFDLTFEIQTASELIFSTDLDLPIILSGNSGFISRYEPTGACILPSEITQNTTLTIDCSPYLANETVIVSPGISLLVEPGVEIWFSENTRFIIRGDLQVNGTETQRVVFKANSAFGAESWGNLTFENSTATSNLNYLEIRDASNGIHPIHHNAAICSWYSVLVMDNLILTNNFSNPIFCEYSVITLTNSTVHSDITGDLINIKYGFGYISDCTFIGNDQPDTDAIDYDEVIDGVIRNSIIQRFLGFNNDGIDLGEQCHDILVENCLIIDCFDKGVSIGQKSNAILKNNTIVNCNQGVGVKDLGEVEVNHITFYSNAINISAFEKNRGHGGGKITVTNSILSNASESVLFVDEFSNGIAESNIYDTDILLGQGNLWMNPLFENPTLNNFKLQPGSNALSAGTDGENLGTLDHRFIADPRIMISDIQYFNSVDADKEFIKVLNSSENVIDISAYSVSGGISFEFPGGTTIEPNEKIMLVRDIDLFTTQEGKVFEWSSGQLANEGELLILTDNFGIGIDHVNYSPTVPWPVMTSIDTCISLISPYLDNHFGSNWKMADSTVVIDTIIPPDTVIVEPFELRAFPNPTSGYITFSAPENISEIQIYDVMGRVVMDVKPDSPLIKLNILTLRNGVYIAVLDRKETFKFIKYSVGNFQ